jgi:hypothetical protein
MYNDSKLLIAYSQMNEPDMLTMGITVGICKPR